MKKHWVHSYTLSASEGSDQTGQMLGLRWTHRSDCWFCHVAAQLWFYLVYVCPNEAGGMANSANTDQTAPDICRSVCPDILLKVC